MLSPQQLQEARANLGIPDPAIQSRQQSFSEKVAALREANKPKLGQGPAGDFAENVVRTVTEPLIRTGGLIEKGLDLTLGRGINKIQGKGFTPTTSGADAMAAADESAQNHADTLAGHIGDFVGTVAPYLTGSGEISTAEALAPKIAELLGVSAKSILPKVTAYLAKKSPTILRDTAIGTAQTGDPVAGAEQGVAAGLPIELLKGAPKTLPKVTGAFKGKTTQEILATPENKLAGLSEHDRKVFFDTQRENLTNSHTAAQEAITQKHTQLETQIKAEGEKKLANLKGQTQDLVNQADRASINEAQALKPKVITAMKENSKTYRELIDKEIAPVRDETVAHSDLWKYIMERNLDNPAKASDMAKRLGLTEGKSSTIGDIYDQMKGLKQDIGSGGKKGTRVFTPDEVQTSDAISTLSDFLKSEKGIDFKEANKFWSQYAPLRDKLIKNVQPFTPQGAESGTFNTFTKDIQNYVSGAKEGKVDFLSATEKLLGTKIGNPETRAALEKLTANQKAQFATKLEQENKLTEAKLLKEQAIKTAKGNLSAEEQKIADKEFEANRQAQTRKNIVKTLGWITGTAVGLEELRRLTGM